MRTKLLAYIGHETDDSICARPEIREARQMFGLFAKWCCYSAGLIIAGSLFVLSSCIGGRYESSPIRSDADQPQAPPTSDRTARFVAVGDIMLSRGVARAIDRAGSSEYPFSKLDNILLNSDLNFGNLESPISGNDRRLGKGLIFNAKTGDLDGLVSYKFKVVNLANNHAFDQGLNGMRSTAAFLEKRGIAHIGVGRDQDEAWLPAVIEANGIRIAFIGASYATLNDGGATRNGHVARVEDIRLLEDAISRAKARSDLVVVTMHAGEEYTRKPNRSQISFAHAAVDAGADLVIGAHPHWIQTMQVYRGKPIFYSLGNFVFDQPWSETRTGLMLRVTVCGSVIEQIEMLPVVIERGAPRQATAIETKQILSKIGINDPMFRPDALK